MKYILSYIAIVFLAANLLYAQNNSIDTTKSNIDKFGYFESDQAFYPGDQSIDVVYYKINYNISYEPEMIQGVVTIGFNSKVNQLDEFFLDFSEFMNVDSIKCDGKLLSFDHNSDFIYISLNSPITLDEECKVDIFIEGKPDPTGFGSFKFSKTNSSPIIWSLSEPYGSKDWFPCKNNPADKADSSDVWITASSNFVSVSNGILEDVIDNSNGTKTYKWKNRYPIANYLIAITMGNYDEYNLKYEYEPGKFMPVYNFVYDNSLSSYRKKQLDKIISMLKIFSEKFGQYPFVKEKYGHVEFGWGGGMEHQTISSMGSFGTSLMAHELAHQWFGDKITAKNWHHVWLNEGFATYLESIYREEMEGKDAYNQSIEWEMEQAKRADGSVYVDDISSVRNIFDSNRSYAKGAVILHMLRGILGDSTFFKVLYSYVNDKKLAYANATTHDFQRIAENVSGIKLDYFFKQWIFGENFPEYNFSWGTKREDAHYIAELKVEQEENSSPQFFKMPIQFLIKLASKDTVITLFNNKQSQVFSVLLPEKPTEIIFDPNNLILKNISYLPVEVGEFSIEKNGVGALLNWNSYYESKNIGFRIDKMEFGTWQEVGYIASISDTFQKQQYSFFDSNFDNHISKYRLVQVSEKEESVVGEVTPQLEIAITPFK